MKKTGIALILLAFSFGVVFPVGAQERQIIATLEIKPEYVMPMGAIEGFDLSGITVVAMHPEITQVSILSNRGVSVSFLKDVHNEQSASPDSEYLIGADAITISFY